MNKTSVDDHRALAGLRDRIDAIDAEMHRLLVERGTIVDALVKAKGTEMSGAAFRPGREADMMRRIVARHAGALPLATVEHIWREIITTFTRLQAPFDVAIDGSADPGRMRDLARFYFGFSVELSTLADAAAVVARVAESGDLGIVAVEQRAGAWWLGLAVSAAPRIMALLPHIGIDGRPADLPAFVVSQRLADPTPPDIRLYAISAKGEFVPPDDGVVLASTHENGRGESLLAVPAAFDVARLTAEAGGSVERAIEIGGIARGIAVDGAESLLYQKPDQSRTAS